MSHHSWVVGMAAALSNISVTVVMLSNAVIMCISITFPLSNTSWHTFFKAGSRCLHVAPLDVKKACVECGVFSLVNIEVFRFVSLVGDPNSL